MRDIFEGRRKYLLLNDVNFVTVPLYDECCPIKVIEKLKLKENSDFL